jgi:hypothetical protein
MHPQYGNIGVKILYAAVLRDIFRFPPLETKVGKITWIIMSEYYDNSEYFKPRNAKRTYSTDLLGMRLYYRRCRSTSQLSRRRKSTSPPSLGSNLHTSLTLTISIVRRRRLHPAIQLHLPANPASRLQRPKRRHAPRRDLRPRNRRSPPRR